jgi:oligopeptide/dipeptide ABC transporter ATP-binding protein
MLMASSHPLLEITDLAVSFATPAGQVRPVDGISLRIGSGETLALVGESGCGKSVTSLAILRLLAPNARAEGQILLKAEGRPPVDLVNLTIGEMRRIRGNRIAMIFQEPMTSLNPLQRIGKQIMESIHLHHAMPTRQARELAEETLQLVGFAEPARRMRNFPHELSGGMRQRVMIAMGLVCRPALLIADEPTTALDVTIQAQILDLMRKLQSEISMSMLFITHDLGVVAEIADRVAVMYAGQIVESGPVRDILDAPRHPYTHGLLNSVPELDGPRQRLQPILGMVPNRNSLPTGCRFAPRCQHAVSGLCDAQVPPLETMENGNQVRCIRWRQLAEVLDAEHA